MSEGWPRALAIAAATWLGLLALTPLTTLWDRDEPRFAQAAVEMLATGDYLVPTFNGELRTQKPPLVYWLMTLSLRAVPFTEVAVRFWAPVGMAIAALATFAIGRRLWSATVGHIAMLVLVLNPLALLQGGAATTDAVLLATTTSAMACGLRVVQQPTQWWAVGGFGTAIGIGLLTKGPIALLIPVAALLCARPSMRALLTLGAGAGVGVAMYLAWLIPAAAATGGAMIERGLVRENLWRFLEPMDGHGTPLLLAPLYYPAVVVIGFLPWSRRLFGGLADLVRSWPGPARMFLLGWVAIPLVIFTLSATKLPHYILPVWPALALAVAAVCGGHEAPATWAAWSRRSAVAALVVLATVGGAAFFVERQKPVPAIAAAVRGSGVEGPLYVSGFDEPSLVFYSGRRTIRLESADAIASWASRPGESVLIVPRDRAAAIQSLASGASLREIAAASGWNYVNGRRLELVAFVRESGR
jgi:4-amino-4-deoxy-L-arabinose transferase-like glycosyltransferase